jgi:hypothetical protein
VAKHISYKKRHVVKKKREKRERNGIMDREVEDRNTSKEEIKM